MNFKYIKSELLNEDLCLTIKNTNNIIYNKYSQIIGLWYIEYGYIFLEYNNPKLNEIISY